MAWLKDDGSLAGDDLLYRRFRRIPEQYRPRDAISGRHTVTNGALRYVSDGMSTYSAALMAEHDVELSDVYTPETHGVTRVSVSQTRQAGLGTVVEPDLKDTNVGRGQSHVLVRSSAAPPDGERWTAARAKLRQHLLLLDEDTGLWEPIA